MKIYRQNSMELSHDIHTLASQLEKAAPESAPWVSALAGVRGDEPPLTLEQLLEKYPSRLHGYIHGTLAKARKHYASCMKSHVKRMKAAADEKAALAQRHGLMGHPKLDAIYGLAGRFIDSNYHSKKRVQKAFEQNFSLLAERNWVETSESLLTSRRRATAWIEMG